MEILLLPVVGEYKRMSPIFLSNLWDIPAVDVLETDIFTEICAVGGHIVGLSTYLPSRLNEENKWLLLHGINTNPFFKLYFLNCFILLDATIKKNCTF